MDTNTNNKVVTLAQLIAAHAKSNDKLTALSKKVEDLPDIEFATDEEVAAALAEIYGAEE